MSDPPPTHLDQPKDASFASAVKWSYVMDGGRQVMTTIITLVLARALGPEAFGLAAMALVYVLFIDMVQRQGMGSALIQRADLRDDHLNAAFWAILGASCLLTLASVLLAGWWADVNDLPELERVVQVMSAFIPIQALIIVHESILRRAMDFRSLAIRTNVAVIVAGVVAVTMAWAGAGVWALVTQQLVSAGIGLVLIWRLCPWRPMRTFSKPAFSDLLGFSAKSFVASVAVFIGNRSDALLIGVFFGPEAAGLYYFASRLVTMVTDLAARALQGASLPELSRHQVDPDRFRARALHIVELSALVSFPVLALVAGASDEIIALIGDDEWGPASTVLRLLTLVGAVRAITFFTGPMLLSLGRPGQHAWLSWAGAALSAGTFVLVGVLYADVDLEQQVIALAVSRVLVHIVLLGIHQYTLRSNLQLTWSALVRPLVPILGPALVGFGLAVLISDRTESIPVLARIAVVGAPAAALIAVLLVRFDPAAREAWAAVRRAAGHRSAVPS